MQSTNKFYKPRRDASDASKFRSWKRQEYFFFFSSSKDVSSDFSIVDSFAEGEGWVETRLRQPGGPGSSHVHLVPLTFDRILVASLPVAFTESRACFYRELNLIYRRISRRCFRAISSPSRSTFDHYIPGTLVSGKSRTLLTRLVFWC